MFREERNILVIEDSYYFQMKIMGILKEAEYGITLANNGSIAYSLVENADLIILDLFLEKVHGVEFLKEIRSKGNYIPVIVITGMPNSREAQEIKNFNIVELLEKPFEKEELLLAVENSFEVVRCYESIKRNEKILDGCIKKFNASIDSLEES